MLVRTYVRKYLYESGLLDMFISLYVGIDTHNIYVDDNYILLEGALLSDCVCGYNVDRTIGGCMVSIGEYY
jgi:hypothetical protein